jgi:hypothetical protein
MLLLGPPLALGQTPFNGPVTGPPNAAEASGDSPATFARPAAPQNVGPQRPIEEEPVITGDLFEPGEVLAIVGNQYVLAGDVLPHVNQVVDQYRANVPPAQLKAQEGQFQEQRRMLLAQLTGAHVDVKILYLAFLRKIPADKLKDVQKRVDAEFDKTLETTRPKVEKMTTKDEYQKLMQQNTQIGRLAIAMKEAGIWSPGELDVLLRKYGGSLAQEKRYYCEFTLGRAVVYQGMNSNPVVTHDEMLKYYREHEKDYLIPTKVRFELMSTRFANFPDKQAAMQAICNMGNEVFYGANFAAVAKRSSQGLNAENGGYSDWTARGSLASKRLDEALFSLEPGKLSQVIEDERGYHIVRVLERSEAGRVSFEEVQVSIGEKLKQEKLGKQYRDVATKLREGVSVWTVFDDDPQLRRAAGRDTGTKRR